MFCTYFVFNGETGIVKDWLDLNLPGLKKTELYLLVMLTEEMVKVCKVEWVKFKILLALMEDALAMKNRQVSFSSFVFHSFDKHTVLVHTVVLKSPVFKYSIITKRKILPNSTSFRFIPEESVKEVWSFWESSFCLSFCWSVSAIWNFVWTIVVLVRWQC